MDDPRADPRTLQANERTLLAWLRIGVSLITFGFVTSRTELWLSGRERPSFVHSGETIGALFVMLGTVSKVISLVRYLRIRKALLERRSVPVGATEIVALGFTVAALGLFLAYFALP